MEKFSQQLINVHNHLSKSGFIEIHTLPIWKNIKLLPEEDNYTFIGSCYGGKLEAFKINRVINSNNDVFYIPVNTEKRLVHPLKWIEIEAYGYLLLEILKESFKGDKINYNEYYEACGKNFPPELSEN